MCALELTRTDHEESARRFLGEPRENRRNVAVLSRTKAAAERQNIADRERRKDPDFASSSRARVLNSAAGFALGSAAVAGGGALGAAAAGALLGGEVGGAAGAALGGLPAVPGMVGGALVGGAVGGAGYLGYRFSLRNRQLPGVPVSISVARHLPFDGRPSENVFYVCHPHKDLYIPMADYHRVVFEDKVREAHDVFQSMGASLIDIRVEEGYKTSLLGKFGVEGVGGLEFGKRQQEQSSFHVRSRFPGSSQPLLDPGEHPDRFCWYSQEEDWRRLYRSRVEAGIGSQEITVGYEKDFGVNARLKATVEGANLDVGGEYEGLKKTLWHFTVEFPEA